MSVPGLSSKAREAVNDAFDAMSTWRTEIAENSEKNLKRVIDKMALAATALGWPEQIADAARSQLQGITKMQMKAIDHLMDAWEEQLKSPNPMTASPAMLSKLQSFPSLGAAGSWPGATSANPLEFWTQFMQQWQKSWMEAMAFWAKAGKPH
jgi:ribonuclease D